jgi:hypothetical protein
MVLLQHTTRSLIGARPAIVAPWLRALASRLLVSRQPDDTLAASYLSTRKWSDHAERGLHAALEHHPRRIHQGQRHSWD